ncbi:MAG: hypothetical protein CSB01_01825 [Bacteroidia bacterium]|nr:MAG: hypothetical protein CSB01_01825 [Bacteroidia bacterium]
MIKIHVSAIFFMLIFLLSIHSYCFANEQIDSLLQASKRQMADTSKVNIYNTITAELISVNTDSAIFYNHEALKLAKKTKYRRGLAFAQTYRAVILTNQGDYPQALEYNDSALRLFSQIKYPKGIAKVYFNIANIRAYQSELDTALSFYFRSIDICKKINNKKGLSDAYNNAGIMYEWLGYYPKAIEYYQKSITIREKIEDKIGIADCLNNIGDIHEVQGEYDEALVKYQRSLDLRKELDDQVGMAYCYMNIGTIMFHKRQDAKALDFFNRALDIRKKIDNKIGMSFTINGIASVYAKQENYAKAIELFKQSLKLDLELDAKSGVAWNNLELSKIYLKVNDLNKATKHIKRVEKIISGFQEKRLVAETNKVLSELYAKKFDYRRAYTYFVKYKAEADSLLNETNIKKIANLKSEYKYEKEKQKLIHEQEKENAIKEEKIKRQKNLKRMFILISFLLILFLIFILYAYFIKRKKNKELKQKNDKISQQSNKILAQRNDIALKNATLMQQKEEILAQRDEIDRQRQDILDSIIYGKRIQDSVLQSREQLCEIFCNYFILFRPKDIVSGDFFWMKKLGDKLIVAVVDCTGHGVPGAFISMLGVTFLNDMIANENFKDSGEKLNYLRNRIKSALNHGLDEKSLRDGLDIALCVIDTKSLKAQFSGANNSMYLVRKRDDAVNLPDTKTKVVKDTTNMLVEFCADKQPVAIHIKERDFSTHHIDLQEGDKIYLFSDGFMDQPGGKNGRRYQSKRFKQLLLEVSNKPIQKQEVLLENAITDWRESRSQIDDILVLGLQI